MTILTDSDRAEIDALGHEIRARHLHRIPSDEASDREPECWDWIDQLQGQVMQVLAAIGVLMTLLLGIAMGIAYL